jgi:hypothetical protein
VHHFLCWDGNICTLWRPPLKTWIQPLPDPDIKQKNPRGHEYQTRLNETRFGPKKRSSPIYLGPINLDTFWWNCQIIFRCTSIQGRAGFILLYLYKQFLRLGQNLPLSYYSLSCLCSANSGPLDNNRRDCNQWWAILAEMFLTNSWQNVVVTMVSMNQYISVMFERCQFKSLWKLMIRVLY